MKRLLILISVVGILAWLGIVRPGNVGRSSGLRDLRAGRTAEAFPSLESYLETAPEDHSTRLLLADAYRDHGMTDLALSHYRILADEPDHRAVALRSAAHAAVESGSLNNSLEFLEALLDLFPDDFAGNLAMGELLFKEHRFRNALPYVRVAIEGQPERAQSYLLLADILAELGRDQEMVEPLERCVELAPENLVARTNLSHAYFTVGRTMEAIEHAEWCIARDPSLVFARLILARSRRDNGEFESALEHARIAGLAEPDNLEAALIEADVLAFQDESASVYDRLQPFLNAHGRNRRLVNHLLRAAIATGKKDEAGALKQRLFELIPD